MIATATKAVCDLLRAEGVDFARCDSPSLRLEKFVRLGPEKTLRHEEIKAVVRCHNAAAREFRTPPPPPCLPQAITFTAKLGGRLIVNQAGGVMENTGLCLHRHFGCPMIPGSAVKGIARHAAWLEWQDERDAARKREIALRLTFVFGYPTGDVGLDDFLASPECLPRLVPGFDRKQTHLAGSVAFLAALAVGKATLTLDIVTCHHPQYYKSKDPRARALDTEDPIPNPFPVVAEGAGFGFTLVPLRRALVPQALFAEKPPVAYAQDWLVQALTVLGAGAKTAAGYGWFDYDAETDRRQAALRLEEERRERETAARHQAEERQRQANTERKARLAALSPDELADLAVSAWTDPQFESRLRNFWKAKGGPSESEKSAMVRALRATRPATWTELKQRGTKGEWARVVDAVRQHARKMGPEKMP